MRLKRLISTGLMTVLVLGLASVVAHGQAEELVMHIPKMTQPPKIDGVINEDEWAGAFATCGFQGVLSGTAYPEALSTLWYIGYDDHNLYMAIRTIIPDSVSLKAEVKAQDQDREDAIVWDDHLEMSLTPYGRTRAMRNGFGNYKICVNPRGVFSDTWYYNGTPGTESLWSSGAQIKCTTTKTSWTTELVWPLSSMKIDKADGTELVGQLTRAGSPDCWYFASSAPGGWLSWNGFYRIVLDPNAPAVQFLRSGDIVHGKLNTVVRVGGKNDGKTTVSVRVEAPRKETLFNETKQLESGKSEADFTADNLPIADHGNSYILDVQNATGRLFNCVMPVTHFTPDYEAKYEQPYLNARPKQGKYAVLVAYLPSFKIVRATLDLDIFGGLPPAIAGTKKFSLEVTPKAGGKVIAKQVFPVKSLAGVGRLNVGDLKDGDYSCILTLLDAQGKELDKRTIPLTRKHYPWEGNQLGQERVVIPPFAPLQVEDKSIKATLATFTIGNGGLFDGVKIAGKDLLGGPMRVETSANGKTSVWQSGDTTLAKGSGRAFPPEYSQYLWKKKFPKVEFDNLPKTDGYEVTTTAHGEVGDVKLALHAVMDYDGWYNVSLTYAPKAGEATVDHLDVVIPLGSYADVMFSGRDFGSQAAAGKIPQGDGIVWGSDQVSYRPVGFQGSWVPYAYLGNGGRGLWYLAESDRGWLLDDAKPCVLIERAGGMPVLRLRLVNTPSTLSTARTVNFTLFATPNQPLPANSRRMIWDSGDGEAELNMEHTLWFNTGWRRYGWGGDDFYMPSDDAYKEFGDFIHYPEKYTELGKTKDVQWTWNYLTQHKRELGDKGVQEDMPVVMYSSHNSISASLPECETYAGEWAGDSELVAKINAHPTNRQGEVTDMMGRYTADVPTKYSEVGATWTTSMIDCYLYYHEKLFRLARVNGTFYDNAGLVWYNDPDTGFGYKRDDGHAQPVSSMYGRRVLGKRANTMCWMLGQPPMFYPNASTFDLSFKQKMILIEGDSYIWTADGTLFDGFEPDAFRAQYISKGPSIHLATSHEAPPAQGYSGTSHRPVRSVIGLGLLFDIGTSRLMDRRTGDRILESLDEEIGLFSAEHQAEFVPYWDNPYVSFAEQTTKGFQKTAPAATYVSLYRQPGKTLLWLVNSGSEAKTEDIWVDDQALLGKTAVRLRDVESGEEMTRGKASTKDPMLANVWRHIYIPPQTFRALVLE